MSELFNLFFVTFAFKQSNLYSSLMKAQFFEIIYL